MTACVKFLKFSDPKLTGCRLAGREAAVTYGKADRAGFTKGASQYQYGCGGSNDTDPPARMTVLPDPVGSKTIPMRGPKSCGLGFQIACPGVTRGPYGFEVARP